MSEQLISGRLPVLALRGLAVFPDQTVHFDVGRSKSVKALEEAMKLFEEGSKLMRVCTAALDEAEQKVNLLMADENGNPQEIPFQGEI